MKKKFNVVLGILILFLVLKFENISIAQTQQWVQRYNGIIENQDKGKAITQDAAGNVYICGYTFREANDRDMYVAKYNSSGTLLWERTLNSGGSGRDEANAIAVDASGNVYITGEGDNDFLTIKYNSIGDTLWTKTYNNATGNDTDAAIAIAIDANGNVFVTGYSDANSSATANNDIVTIKYNATGVTQWTKTYAGAGNTTDEPTGLALDNSNNVYVVGTFTNINADNDIVLLKYDAAGNQTWIKTIDNGGNDEGKAVVTDAANVYITGETDNGSDADAITIKYNLAGTAQWLKTLDSGDNDKGADLTVDATGNVFVAARSRIAIDNYDIITIKYNSAGTQQFINQYNSGFDDRPTAICTDGAGNAFISGKTSTVAGATPIYNAILLKANANGAPTFTKTYAGTANADDAAQDIIVNASGLYFTGYLQNTSTQNDIITVKLNTTTGTETWKIIYNGKGDNTDVVKDITVDANGNSYVTGYTFIKDNDRDIITIKYNNNGVLQWSKTYNSVLNNNKIDEGKAIAVDASGNVYVCGIANKDYVTIKYNSAGTALWTSIYNNTSGNGTDEAVALAVDATGNVYVSGFSDKDPSSISNYDIVTVKYNNLGVQQWALAYNGAANQDDILEDMILDNNTLYLTGTTENAALNTDVITLAINTATGTQIWATPYSSANFNDKGNAIAIKNNNIYVAGRKGIGLNNDDALLLKYNNSGVQQWAKTYDKSGEERFYALNIDSLENIYAVGKSFNGTDNDALLIKFGSDGIQQWLANFDGGFNDTGEALYTNCSGVYIVGTKADVNDKTDLAIHKFNINNGNIIWTTTYSYASPNLNDEPIKIIAPKINSTVLMFIAANSNDPLTQSDITTLKYQETNASCAVATVKVKIKVFLQGPYLTGTMSTALQASNLLPLSQPYNTSPWNYNKAQTVATMPTQAVDWVLVEIRSAADYNTKIDTVAALLYADGTIHDIDGTDGVSLSNAVVSGNSYYIVVRHRNHLDVMSANTVNLPNTTYYDFSTAASKAFGANQQIDLGNAVFGLYAGDISANGIISVSDFNIYQQQPSATNVYNPRDLNLNKIVSVTDYNLYQSHPSIIGIQPIRY